MVDRRLIARLDAARVSFCLVGDRAREVYGCPPRGGDVELLTVDESVLRALLWQDAPRPRIDLGDGDPWMGRLHWDFTPAHHLLVGRDHAAIFAVDTAKPNDDLGCRVATPLCLLLLALEEDGSPAPRLGWRAPRRRGSTALAAAVDRHLGRMPPLASESWHHAVPRWAAREAASDSVIDWATIVGADFAAPGAASDHVDGSPGWVAPGGVDEVQAVASWTSPRRVGARRI